MMKNYMARATGILSGIPASKISSVDMLSYIGNQGMGALEYDPFLHI